VTTHELGEQAGRTFVVTGANSGIGLETTRALVDRGAHVVMAVRAMTRGDLVDPTPYDGKQVYRNSKQANLLFAQEFDRRCSSASSRVTAVAAHPGAVSTNLFARQLERAGRPRLARISKGVTSLLLPSAAAGSRTTLRALDAATPSGSLVAPSGRTQFRGSPELAEVYPSARDPETAARLWELTEELHGIAAPV